MGFRYSESAVPAGTGIREESLHVGTGLRNATVDAVISTTILGISGITLGPFVDSAAYSSIKGTTWLGHLPVPMTPMLLGAYIAGASATFQFRVTGYDQFDSHIVEITPPITVGASAGQNFQICLSKVFRFVDNVEYRSNGITALSLDVGWSTCIDPTGIEAAGAADYFGTTVSATIKTYGTWKNWGLGTPLRMSPWSTALPASTQPNFAPTRLLQQQEVQGFAFIRLRNTQATITIINDVTYIPIFGDTSSGNTTIRLGQSSGGFSSGGDSNGAWQGTPHKIGFVSSDNWATGFSKKMTGSSTRASGIPTTVGQFGEDQIQIVASLRSLLGTRRFSTPEPNYPKG